MIITADSMSSWPTYSSGNDFNQCSLANGEEHHRCRRKSLDKFSLLKPASCPSVGELSFLSMSVEGDPVNMSPRNNKGNSSTASSLPISIESLLAASFKAPSNGHAEEKANNSLSQFSNNMSVDDATMAFNNLMLGANLHPFVSSSPTTADHEDDFPENTANAISISNNDFDFTDWDLNSPPTDEIPSPVDEGVVLNSTSCSDHQLTSSSVSSTVSSTPLSVSTASTTSQGISICQESYNSSGKKRVRFADAHGMPLTAVCTYANTPVGSLDDSANSTPVATTLSRIFNLVQAPSQYGGNNGSSSCLAASSAANSSPSSDSDCMELLFPDPLTNYSILQEKLRTNNIAVESVCCRNGHIKGVVRVRNLSFAKNVFVRISFDAWATSQDWPADYFPLITPSEGRSEFDLFEFSVAIPPHLMPGTIVDFCVCYKSENTGEFWDNNGGRNFSLRYRPLLANRRTSNPVQTSTLTRAKNAADIERAKRIREFVWTEFASWNGGPPVQANNKISLQARATDMPVCTTTTAPAGKEMPYW